MTTRHDAIDRPRFPDRINPLTGDFLMLLPFLALALSQADAGIPPVDPEAERSSFVLPEGWTAQLWAADPLIAKPIQMNFAPDGKLWVATSRTYPQVEPGNVGQDQIIILDDTDGDGEAEERTVFADDLLIPTGLVPGDGGCYVANSTELLYLKDTDGDGRADQKSILLSGFGTEDTHHLIHTFRWGPAQRLNFAQSIYIHSHLETPDGVKRLDAGGFWVLRPDTLELDVFAYGLINPWGLAWTRTGQTFATDGAGGEGINWLLPGGYYKTAANAPRLLAGLNPGSPKHCGLAIVDGETIPEDWRGSMITCDFRGHRVCRFDVTDRASVADVDPADLAATDLSTATAEWSSRERPELIKSDFPAFRPIDVRQGPDGAVYIADWYNPIIQHGEVDFRDPRRDKTHGRIWRLTYEGRTTPRVNYQTADDTVLFDTLQNGAIWQTALARRVLVERAGSDPSVLDRLETWVRQLDASGPNAWVARLNALWVQHGSQRVDPFALDFLLRCPDAGVRAASYRVLGEQTATWRQDALERLHQPAFADDRAVDLWHVRLLQGVTDYSPRVRLEAVRIAKSFATPEAISIALSALDHPIDANLDYALFLTARETQDRWFPLVREGKSPFARKSHSLFAYRASGSPQATPLLIDLLEDDTVGDSERHDVVKSVVRRATVEQLARLVRIAAETESDATASAILSAVATSSKRDAAGKRLSEAEIDKLLDRTDAAGPQAAVFLVLCGIANEQATRKLDRDLAKAVNEDRTDEITTTVRAIIQTANADAIERSLMTAASALPAVESDRLLADAAASVPALVAAIATADADSRPSRTVIDALLRSEAGTEALQSELTERKLRSDVARDYLAAIQAAGRPLPKLTELITTNGSLAEAKRVFGPELLASVEAALPTADAARGEAVYRRTQLACQKCHAIGGSGGLVGPELRSLGAASPLDYIVESLVAPNARVKEGYNALLVLTDEGQLVTGVPVRRSEDLLVLRDANGLEREIPNDAIDAEKPADSLMPAGLVDPLPEQDFVDLVAFLSSLGKEPRYTVTAAPVVRRFEAMTPDNNAAYLLRRQSYAAAANKPDQFVWQPVYARVDGSLPLDDLPLVVVKNRSAAGQVGVSFVRIPFEMTAAGQMPFSLDETDRAASNVQTWIDDEPVDLWDSSLNVAVGRHTLTVGLVRTGEAESRVRLDYDPDNVTLR